MFQGFLDMEAAPPSIPLIEHEVVDNYEWMTVKEFSEMLAMGNALPGPIATKMAGYIGYQQGGILGVIIGVFATVAPSMIMMFALLGLLMKHKPRYRCLANSFHWSISYILMERRPDEN